MEVNLIYGDGFNLFYLKVHGKHLGIKYRYLLVSKHFSVVEMITFYGEFIWPATWVFMFEISVCVACYKTIYPFDKHC